MKTGRLRSRRWVLVAAVLAMVVGACSGSGGPTDDTSPRAASGGEEVSGPRWGGSLIVALPYDVSNFNDNYDADSRFPYVAPNIYSRLVNYDHPTSTLYGDLASDWEVNDDGTVYTFNLREGVTWHDGEEFNADDVVFTYQSILDEGDSATTYPLYSDIVDIEAPDDHTVVFTLEQPSSVFLSRLADYYGAWILPEHLFGEGDPREAPANQAPVGTGPFTFVDHEAGDSITLARNPDHHGQVPYVDELIFRVIPNRSTALAALKGGEIHYTSASPPFAEVESLRDNPNLRVDLTRSEVFQWLALNVERPELSDVRVRRAIAMAINTEQLNDVVYHGLAVPGETMFRSDSWATDTSIHQPAHDPEQARQLLDEAGYPADDDGIRFSLDYTTWNTSIFGGPELAQVVKQQLLEVGIEVTIETNDFSLYQERIREQYDYDLNASGGLHGPDPDAWATYFTSTSTRNDTQFNSPELDDLFQQGRTVLDEAGRKEVYAQVQQVLADEVPRINLVEYMYIRPYTASAHDFWWSDVATQQQIGQDMYNLVWLDEGSTDKPEELK